VKSVFYGSITTQGGSERWPNLMEDIGYQDDTWFDGLYKIRPRYISHVLGWYDDYSPGREHECLMDYISKKAATLENFGSV
jgi:hypothetical protein